MGSLSAIAQGSGERYFQGKDDMEDAASTEKAITDRAGERRHQSAGEVCAGGD